MKYYLKKPDDFSQEEYNQTIHSLIEKGLVILSNNKVPLLTDIGLAVAVNNESIIPLNERN